MSVVTLYRVKRGTGANDGVWFVDIGREFNGVLGKRTKWDRFVTNDHGDSWAAMVENYGWWPSFLLHPDDEMKQIDVLLGAIIPHLQAAGLGDVADKQRRRQEEYWARQKRVRELAPGDQP